MKMSVNKSKVSNWFDKSMCVCVCVFFKLSSRWITKINLANNKLVIISHVEIDQMIIKLELDSLISEGIRKNTIKWESLCLKFILDLNFYAPKDLVAHHDENMGGKPVKGDQECKNLPDTMCLWSRKKAGVYATELKLTETSGTLHARLDIHSFIDREYDENVVLSRFKIRGVQFYLNYVDVNTLSHHIIVLPYDFTLSSTPVFKKNMILLSSMHSGIYKTYMGRQDGPLWDCPSISTIPSFVMTTNKDQVMDFKSIEKWSKMSIMGILRLRQVKVQNAYDKMFYSLGTTFVDLQKMF